MNPLLKFVLVYIVPIVIYLGFLSVVLWLSVEEKISENTSFKIFKWNLIPVITISFLANLYLTILSLSFFKGFLYSEFEIDLDDNFIGRIFENIRETELYDVLFAQGEHSVGFLVIAIVTLFIVAFISLIFYGHLFDKRTIRVCGANALLPCFTIIISPVAAIVCTVCFITFTVFAIKDIRNITQ